MTCMNTIITSEGFEADVTLTLQPCCDMLNATHFDGALPLISAFAVSRFKHPTMHPLHAISIKTEEIPELQGLAPLG